MRNRIERSAEPLKNPDPILVENKSAFCVDLQSTISVLIVVHMGQISVSRRIFNSSSVPELSSELSGKNSAARRSSANAHGALSAQRLHYRRWKFRIRVVLHAGDRDLWIQLMNYLDELGHGLLHVG